MPASLAASIRERQREGRLPVLSEIKARSPKDGDLLRGRDPGALAETMGERPIAGLSVVTEPSDFGGDLAFVTQARARVRVPILCKDFHREPADLEAAAARDAVASRARLFQAFFEIRPAHNPLGPFDFAGSYDERSDRAWALTDLIDRGFDDGYRQFVNPVVAPSGEEMQPTPRPRPPTPVSPLA